MRSPIISVCMPMYNASRYLRECIDSVLAQTFTDFEFLIADDGSTDNSVEIVESYSDPRIRLIKREHDYIATLNCLLSEARGEYIARMDADDVMLPTRLQLQVDHMDANPEVDVLGGEMIYINEHSIGSDIFTNHAQTITLKELAEQNQLNHPSIFIRNSTLRKLGLRYNKEYIYAEDYKLWSDFAKENCKIENLNVPIAEYRIHNQQVSNINATQQNQLADKIRYENRLYAAQKANKTYSTPKILPTSKQLTVIIPFLNEGMEVVNTVASVREYAKDSVDIIIINDFSYDAIDYGELLKPYDVYYFVNYRNLGVAASRDFGVSICQTPYFLLLDAHMRFYESECFATICRLLTENDRRLLCCQSTAIDPDVNGILLPRSNYKLAFGAYSPYDMSSLWPNIKWNNYEKCPGQDYEPIELVLGAGYAASKRYWTYLKGLYGLRGYGFDEAYISTKVWMEGGECLLLKKHILGHLYRNESPYFTSNFNMIFNSLLISTLLMSRSYRNWSYAIALNNEHAKSLKAISQIRNNKELIAVKSYYQSTFSIPYETIVTRNLKSQAPLYVELKDKINHTCSQYLKWLKSEHKNLSAGMRNGGLSSVLLFLALYGKTLKQDINHYIANIIKQIEQLTVTKLYNNSFDEGMCGIGWLLIGMHRYGIISKIPCQIIRTIDSRLDSIDLEAVDLKDFNKGIGALLCYCCARLYALDHIEDNSSFVNTDKLMILRDLALKALSTPQCDSRTYYHALEFLDAISLEIDEYKWTPNLYDVVFCSEKPILDINNGGYDLYSGVMRNWAFATIHQIKTNQV